MAAPGYQTLAALKPTAAPAAAPAASPFAALLAPVDTRAIMGEAHAQALANTNAIVQGVKANQAAVQQQAQQAAQNEQQAALGAAHFLQGLNLGGKLSDAYRQAGNDQAGLAAGFSGELQRTVGDQAAQVSKGLAALGAPGGAPTTAPAAGNAVYALGGQIPANELLAQAPGAVAEAQGAVRGLVGQGQQAAEGTIGAGQQAAARLNPQITAALAKEPALAQSLFAGLDKAAETGRQNNVHNYISQEGVDARTAATAERTAYDQGRLKLDTTKVNNDESYKTAKLHIDAVKANNDAAYKTAQLDATKAYRSGQLTIDEYKATTARLKEQRTASNPDSALSGRLGMLVNPSGQPILGPDGKPQILPGFKPGANGALPVKVGKNAAAGGQTVDSFATASRDLTKQVSAWGQGAPAKQHYPAGGGAPTAVPGTGTAPVPYAEAKQMAINSGPNTAAWRAKAIKTVDSSPYYQMGQNGRPYDAATARRVAFQGARQAYQAGVPYATALQSALAHGGLPRAAILAAMQRAYGPLPLTARVGPTGPLGVQAVG